MRYIEIDARNVLWENQKEFIHELCNRANNDFVRKYIKTTIATGIINDFPAELTKKSESQLPTWAKGKTNELYEINIDANNKEKFFHYVDYLNTLPNAPIKIAFSDLPKKVQEWENEKVNADSIGKVKKVFTDGEFEWYQLLDGTALEYESKYMQHCVGKGGYTEHVKNGNIIIYSLRKNNKPHATIDIRRGEIYQIKGKQNAPVVEKYRPYIIKFLNQLDLNIHNFNQCKADFIANNFVFQNNKVQDALKIKDWKNTIVYAEMAQKLLNEGASLNHAYILGGAVRSLLQLDNITLNNVILNGIIIKGKGKLVDCELIHSDIDEFEGYVSGNNSTNLNIKNSKITFDLKSKSNSSDDGLLVEESEISGKLDVRLITGYFIMYGSKLKNVTGSIEAYKLHVEEKSLISCPQLEINTTYLYVKSESKLSRVKSIKVKNLASFKDTAPYLPNNMETSDLTVYTHGRKKPAIPKDIIVKHCLESDCFHAEDYKDIKGLSHLAQNTPWDDSYLVAR